MGVHSGKWALVDGVGALRNWNVSDTEAPAVMVASNTLGGTVRKPGIRDFTGSFSAFGGLPPVLPGSYFNFVGFTAPDNDSELQDITPSAGEILSGPAIVESVAITVDWSSGAVVSYVTNFAGNGELVESNGIPTLDSSLVSAVDGSAEGAKIEVGPSPGGPFVEMCNVLNATLNLVSPNTPYVNSCTDGWTMREPGIKDWNMSIAVQDNERLEGLPFPIGSDQELQLYVNATSSWKLKWGHVKDYSGITADRESGAIIGATVNLEMNGIVADVVGNVQFDNDIPFWPPFVPSP